MSQQLTIKDLAARMGLVESTIRSYITRGTLPEPDGRMGSTPWWWEETIDAHHRPGQGFRSDRRVVNSADGMTFLVVAPGASIKDLAGNHFWRRVRVTLRGKNFVVEIARPDTPAATATGESTSGEGYAIVRFAGARVVHSESDGPDGDLRVEAIKVAHESARWPELS